MTKYYIKEGYEEKGPLTILELKKIGISKTSFVRQQNNEDWAQAKNINELNSIFKRRFRVFKLIGLSLLSFIVIAIIVSIIYNTYINPYSPYSSFDEIEAYIPPPPSIDFSITNHKKRLLKELFKDCNLSGEKRQLVEACNYTNSSLRNLAVSIAGKDPGQYNLGQICNIFDYCYDNWKYVNDPYGQEVIEFASNTISNGLNGDCDDFAVLVCSMILAIGGEARINFAYGENGGHAFTEVNIGKTSVEAYISKRYRNVYDDGVWSRIDKDGNQWLNLDWFAKHPGGEYFEYKRGTSFYILQQYCTDFTNK